MRHYAVMILCLFAGSLSSGQLLAAPAWTETQTPDTLLRDTLITLQDTVVTLQDTVVTLQDTVVPSQDTVITNEYGVVKDSARLAVEEKTRIAWRRSMILPGWGQITNGGIWWIKVPVIYGGFVTTGLVFEFNNRYYRSILKDVQYRLANNHAYPPGSPYDYIAADQQGTQYLINAKDYYRRNRDLMILVTVGWYALNITEAYVDSMLKNRWDIGDSYSMKVSPFITPASTPLAPSALAFGFHVKLNISPGSR